MDRRLLTRLQADFPLEVRPFAALGWELGLAEEEVIERLRQLKAQRILRQVSAIFDSRLLGYQTTLVAFKVPESRLEEAGAVVSLQPGVSHNYARDHHFNLWFTWTLPERDGMAQRVSALATQARAESFLLLPALRVFKIGVTLDLEEGRAVSRAKGGDNLPQASRPPTVQEREAVRELQRDLTLEAQPFLSMAQRLGMDEETLLDVARDMQRRGIMRRYGAVLHHREAGFTANAMVCWPVPPERTETVGHALAAFPEVTHCYQRPTYPDWPYSILSMVHAPQREECYTLAERMGQAVQVKDYVLLFSHREFKKARVKYFEEAAQ